MFISEEPEKDFPQVHLILVVSLVSFTHRFALV